MNVFLDKINLFLQNDIVRSIIKTLIPIAIIAFLKFIKNYNQKSIKVEIKIPEPAYNVEYYLLFIKNGKDEFTGKDHYDLENKKIKMKKISSNYVRAVVKAKKRIGFQFKCFAKCDNIHKNDLKNKLTDLGYKFVEPAIYNDYIWFILNGYDIYVTFDKYVNNYYHHINKE